MGTSYGPVSVFLSVCLSVTCRCSIEVDGRLELVFGTYVIRRLFWTYPTLCFKEIQVSTKIRVLSFTTLSGTPDLENFASVCRSSNRVIDLAQQWWTLRA